MIRFITSDCKELFKLPDGGSIVVTLSNGEQYVGDCKYLDEMHMEVDGECFHICQFAELQERNGAKVEPEKEPEMVGNYRVKYRIPVDDKVFIMGHNPKSPSRYVTWQGFAGQTGVYESAHYWKTRTTAWSDLLCRADAERSGKPYDHTWRTEYAGDSETLPDMNLEKAIKILEDSNLILGEMIEKLGNTKAADNFFSQHGYTLLKAKEEYASCELAVKVMKDALPIMPEAGNDEEDSVNRHPAKTLPGWVWVCYSDGSGHLEAPDGKSYFIYDRTTSEYMVTDGKEWNFFDGYPYATCSFGEFQAYAESRMQKQAASSADGHIKALNKIFDQLRTMEIIPFGCILDFLIEQGLTKEQTLNWFDDAQKAPEPMPAPGPVNEDDAQSKHVGAVCDFCGGNMLLADGCKPSVINRDDDDKAFERIKMGDSDDFYKGSDPDHRCGDCGAKPGHYHHPGCDLERCPICGGQLISCDCEFTFKAKKA
jgi:hypothetical protein